jgi:hypothetical protein
VSRHVARLIVDYFAYAVHLGASARYAARRVLRHVVRLVTRLVVDYFAYAARQGASALRAARRRLLRLHRTSGCLGSSRGSSSTNSPRAGMSSTTSPTPCVRVPRHVARFVTRPVVDYFAYATHLGASACRAGHRRLLRLLRTSGCLGTLRGSSCASASHMARHAARCAARRRLLCLRRASGFLGTSRGSSLGSSSTTSPTPRVREPHYVARLVARLVVNYFDGVMHMDAPSRRSTSHRSVALAPAMRPVTLSRGSTTSCTTAAISSCGCTGSTTATPCVMTTCLAATPALL